MNQPNTTTTVSRPDFLPLRQRFLSSQRIPVGIKTPFHIIISKVAVFNIIIIRVIIVYFDKKTFTHLVQFLGDNNSISIRYPPNNKKGNVNNSASKTPSTNDSKNKQFTSQDSLFHLINPTQPRKYSIPISFTPPKISVATTYSYGDYNPIRYYPFQSSCLLKSNNPYSLLPKILPQAIILLNYEDELNKESDTGLSSSNSHMESKFIIAPKTIFDT